MRWHYELFKFDPEGNEVYIDNYRDLHTLTYTAEYILGLSFAEGEWGWRKVYT